MRYALLSLSYKQKGIQSVPKDASTDQLNGETVPDTRNINREATE